MRLDTRHDLLYFCIRLFSCIGCKLSQMRKWLQVIIYHFTTCAVVRIKDGLGTENGRKFYVAYNDTSVGFAV